METCAIHSMRAPYKPRASLVVPAPFALIMITLGLGVSEIGHFQTVNRIFGQHFSKNTASVRAFIYQFCPKESLWDNISHLDCGLCWVMGISCSIANDNVKLVFWVKVGMDLGPLLAFSDG